MALKECSQCVAINGRSEEASQRYSEGWRVGLNDVRASAPCAKHEIEPPLSLPERFNTVTLPGYSGAWRHHLETTAVHPDR
jgi:hypothetical protein